MGPNLVFLPQFFRLTKWIELMHSIQTDITVWIYAINTRTQTKELNLYCYAIPLWFLSEKWTHYIKYPKGLIGQLNYFLPMLPSVARLASQQLLSYFSHPVSTQQGKGRENKNIFFQKYIYIN